MRMACAISGMVAVHARHAVFTALSGVPGVLRAEVELGCATVECAPGSGLETVRAAITEAVAAVGYVVTEVRELPRTLPTVELEG